MTSLLVKAKRDKKKKNGTSSSRLLLKVNQEKMDGEVDSGNSTFDSTFSDWDLSNIKPETPLDAFPSTDEHSLNYAASNSMVLEDLISSTVTNDDRQSVSHGRTDIDTPMKTMLNEQTYDQKLFSTTEMNCEGKSINNSADLTFRKSLKEEKEKDSDVDEVEEDGKDQPRIGLFSREITQMLYAAGDAGSFTESIKFLNDLTIDYVTELTCKAMTVGKIGQIDVQDILYLSRKCHKKHSRIKSLIEVNEDLKSARRAFDDGWIQDDDEPTCVRLVQPSSTGTGSTVDFSTNK